MYFKKILNVTASRFSVFPLTKKDQSQPMVVPLMLVQHCGTASGEWAKFAAVLESVGMDVLLVSFHGMDCFGKMTTKVAGEAAICNAAIRSVFHPDVVV